jgi:hypothetical protein
LIYQFEILIIMDEHKDFLMHSTCPWEHEVTSFALSAVQRKRQNKMCLQLPDAQIQRAVRTPITKSFRQGSVISYRIKQRRKKTGSWQLVGL